jgi:hypothetical protein
MSPLPFRPTPNVNKLHRQIALWSLTDIGTPMCSDTGEVHAFAPPLHLVRERISDYVFETNPGQSTVCFINASDVLGNQDELLGGCDEHRRPTCEGTNEANLDRTSDMKCDKLFGNSYVENESAISLLFKELGGC